MNFLKPVAKLSLVGMASAELLAFPFLGTQRGDGGGPGEYLVGSYPSGRAAGLAGAGSTLVAEPAAFYYNPASLSRLKSSEAAFLHTLLPNSFQFSALGYAHPLGNQTAAFNILRYASPDAERTDVFGDNLGSFRDEQISYVLSVGRRTSSKTALGASLKIATQNLDGSFGVGYGADAGGLILLGSKNLLGVTLHHIGGPRIRLAEETETFPTLLRAGYSRLALDGRVRISTDLLAGSRIRRWAVGVEYSPWPLFSLRSGINQREAALGLGIRFQRVRLDYAASLQDLGLVHAFGTSFRFGLPPAEQEEALYRSLSRDRESLHEKMRSREKQLDLRERNLISGEEALHRERQAVEKSERLQAKVALAQGLMDSGKEDEAQALVSEVLTEEPRHPPALRLDHLLAARRRDLSEGGTLDAAKLAYAQGSYSAAMDLATRTLSHRPEDREVRILLHLARAQVHLTERNPGKAAEELDRLLRLNPVHREARRLRNQIRP